MTSAKRASLTYGEERQSRNVHEMKAPQNRENQPHWVRGGGHHVKASIPIRILSCRSRNTRQDLRIVATEVMTDTAAFGSRARRI